MTSHKQSCQIGFNSLLTYFHSGHDVINSCPLNTHSESTPTIFPSFVSRTFPGTEIPKTFSITKTRRKILINIFLSLSLIVVMQMPSIDNKR